jgi:hypothetical protein
MRIARTSSPALCALASLLWLQLAGAEEFEAPPELPAAQVLAAELAAGAEYRVDDPVRNDGLNNHYSLLSRFGSYDVSGRALLAIRVREIGALVELERVSKSDVFVNAVGRTVAAPIETVVDVAKNPIGTVTGIPKGVANLFNTYKLKTRDAAASIQRDTEKDGKETAPPGKEGALARQANSYALKYFGVTKAERRWYAKLGVDPYTTNEALRSAVKKVARIDATASFGLRFAGMPGIAGIGVVRTGMNAIWREDPVLIRERNRKFLSSIGIDKEEIGRFEDNPWLSPTHQVAILAMVRALKGSDGRDELIHRAIDVGSEEEALTLIESIGLLVEIHQSTALVTVLGGIRLPAARTQDGRLVVCAGFESVYWTERVAEGLREITNAYRETQASNREIWLAGDASPRVRAELEHSGWKLRRSVNLGPQTAFSMRDRSE